MSWGLLFTDSYREPLRFTPMYCPNCGVEYREGFTRCSDCLVALQPGPPPEPEADDRSRLAWQEEFGDAEPLCGLIEARVIDAEITVNALRHRGVRAFAAGAGLEQWSDAGGLGQITGVDGPLNEIRIMVHPDDFRIAQRVIDDARNVELEPDPPVIPGEEAAWRVDRGKRKRVLKAIALFLLVPLLLALAYEAVVAIRIFFDTLG